MHGTPSSAAIATRTRSANGYGSVSSSPSGATGSRKVTSAPESTAVKRRPMIAMIPGPPPYTLHGSTVPHVYRITTGCTGTPAVNAPRLNAISCGAGQPRRASGPGAARRTHRGAVGAGALGEDDDRGPRQGGGGALADLLQDEVAGLAAGAVHHERLAGDDDLTAERDLLHLLLRHELAPRHRVHDEDVEEGLVVAHADPVPGPGPGQGREPSGGRRGGRAGERRARALTGPPPAARASRGP